MPQLILIIVGVVFALLAIVYVLTLLAVIAAISLFVVAFNYGVAQIISVQPLSVNDYKKISKYSYVVMIVVWFLFQTFVYPAQPQESYSYLMSAIFWPWIIFSHIMSANNDVITIFYFSEYERLLYPLTGVYFFSLLGTSFTYLWNSKQREAKHTVIPRLKSADFWITGLFTASILLVPSYLVSGRLIAITTGNPLFAGGKQGELIKEQIASDEHFRRKGDRVTFDLTSIFKCGNDCKVFVGRDSKVFVNNEPVEPELKMYQRPAFNKAWGMEESYWVLIAKTEHAQTRSISGKSVIVYKGGYLINGLTGEWFEFDAEFESVDFSGSGYFLLLFNRNYKIGYFKESQFHILRIPAYIAKSDKKLEIKTVDILGNLWGRHGKIQWTERLDNKGGAFGRLKYKYDNGSVRSGYINLPRNAKYYQ